MHLADSIAASAGSYQYLALHGIACTTRHRSSISDFSFATARQEPTAQILRRRQTRRSHSAILFLLAALPSSPHFFFCIKVCPDFTTLFTLVLPHSSQFNIFYTRSCYPALPINMFAIPTTEPSKPAPPAATPSSGRVSRFVAAACLILYSVSNGLPAHMAINAVRATKKVASLA